MDRVVFLLDVDNTLLDNDRVAADLKRFLVREVGAQAVQQAAQVVARIAQHEDDRRGG